MCEPVTMGGLVAAGSAMQFAQQSAQARAQNKINALNRENAKAAFINSQNQLTAKTLQQAASAGQAISQVRSQADRSRAAATLSAAESGVKGRSVEDVIGDFTRQEGEYVAAALLNEQFQREAAAYERTGTGITLSGQLASNAEVAGPSIVVSALQAGVAGLSAYNTAKAAEAY